MWRDDQGRGEEASERPRPAEGRKGSQVRRGENHGLTQRSRWDTASLKVKPAGGLSSLATQVSEERGRRNQRFINTDTEAMLDAKATMCKPAVDRASRTPLSSARSAV